MGINGSQRELTGVKKLSHCGFVQPRFLLPFCILAFLWFRLIDHLRIEWSVNPQYAYGWAVPFLCAYLIWRRANSNSLSARGKSRGEVGGPVVQWSSGLILVLALLYAPTRLVQEANPEWRLVSWLLALEVVGLTLLLLPLLSHGPVVPWSRGLLFPICFFLVAVPWPTVLEAPLIQGLTRADAAATIELLNFANIPAVQHGSVIEISNGLVGIDEACSGIRSFQAALMICLLRRLALMGCGLVFAFLFNIGRTFLLVRIAAARGIGAIGFWHDPAGVTILVLCFFSLWALAVILKPRLVVPDPDPDAIHYNPSPIRRPQVLFFSLAAWLILVELGTESWYRLHERVLPAAATWRVTFPTENPSFRNLVLPDNTSRMLRCDEALDGSWWENAGQRWQAIFLRWEPGRAAVHLAKSHTPEVCLTAAGRELLSQSGPRYIAVGGLDLPFRCYVLKDAEGPLRVFYCLWEDRAAMQSFSTMNLSYANRLAPVLAGRRNPGERSLELAVWGISDESEATAAFISQVNKLIKIDRQ
jgi:exosortase